MMWYEAGEGVSNRLKRSKPAMLSQDPEEDRFAVSGTCRDLASRTYFVYLILIFV
jgi:hypothetical protein